MRLLKDVPSAELLDALDFMGRKSVVHFPDNEFSVDAKGLPDGYTKQNLKEELRYRSKGLHYVTRNIPQDLLDRYLALNLQNSYFRVTRKGRGVPYLCIALEHPQGPFWYHYDMAVKIKDYREAGK